MLPLPDYNLLEPSPHLLRALRFPDLMPASGPRPGPWGRDLVAMEDELPALTPWLALELVEMSWPGTASPPSCPVPLAPASLTRRDSARWTREAFSRVGGLRP